jgi:hypothetical protein
MTILICSGTLYSGWQQTAALSNVTGPQPSPVSTKLTALSEKICRQQFPETDELDWKPFSPSEEDTNAGSALLSLLKNEPFFAWADNHSSLYLDYWNSTIEDAGFLLFYSSPEFELSRYIIRDAYNTAQAENVMRAWLIRSRAMLAFFMNNRSRCLLVNVQSAESEQQLFTSVLSEHFKLKLDNNHSTVSETSKALALEEYLASSLLLGDETVAELYDEIRSAATIICEQDKAMPDIKSRSNSLIDKFLQEAASYRELAQSHKQLEEDLNLTQLQFSQVTEELEYYFNTNKEQEKIFTDYLRTDPLLNTARQVRKSQ